MAGKELLVAVEHGTREGSFLAQRMIPTVGLSSGSDRVREVAMLAIAFKQSSLTRIRT